MSFFNMFSGNQQQAPAPQQQQQPASQQPNPAQPDPQVPAFNKSTNTDPKDQQQPTSGLDQFNDLFSMDSDDGDEPQPDPYNDPFFAYDSAKAQEKINSMDFANNPQFRELSQKALQGDADAFTTILNGVARAVFSQSIEMSAAMANRVGKVSLERAGDVLPSKVRSLLSGERLSENNSIVNHPAAKPMVDSVRAQMEAKYPAASPREISEKVNSYLTEFVKAFASPPSDDPTKRPTQQQSKAQDFQGFFG